MSRKLKPVTPFARLDLRCPGEYRSLLGRWAPTPRFIELECCSCRKAVQEQDSRISKVLHRYSTETGELLETVYQIGLGPKTYLVTEESAA